MKQPVPFGKYLLLERISVGGMAEVFRAKAFGVEGFERLIAVKRILPSIAEDKDFIRMFIDEAKLSVQLGHANIAQVFDLGNVEGAYYIALEHVHGRDARALFDRCRQLGDPMPIAQACFVLMKICEGLDYAHNKRDQAGKELGLVHRDVSPQNVLISFDGEVKLIDFGVAKAAGKQGATQAGVLKGKFGYMSPEQVRGIPVDRRSDVFACGIVLYELLTGERLFQGESDLSIMEKVRHVEILPPTAYNRRIPDELERIVLKALTKDTDDRYQNAIDLHDELQAFVYTSGEFYSRKDLAAWMKKTFSNELAEETARLEQFRRLRPPSAPPTAVPPAPPIRPATGSRPPPMPAAARRQTTQPPGFVNSTTPGVMAGSMVTPGPNNRPTVPVLGQGLPNSPNDDDTVDFSEEQQGATRVDPAVIARLAEEMNQGRAGALPKIVVTPMGEELQWDEEELETQIYDNAPDGAAPPSSKKRSARQGDGPVSTPSSPVLPTTPSVAQEALKHTATAAASTVPGWPARPKVPTIDPATASTASLPMLNRVSPTEPLMPIARESTVPPDERGVPGPALAIPSPVPSFHSETAVVAPFGRLTPAPSRWPLAIVALVTVLAGAVLYMVFLRTPASTVTPSGEARPSNPPMGDQATGIDLYVTPLNVTSWRLDGELRTDKLPSRIRGIAPGPHRVDVDPPQGYMSQTQQVMVEAGVAAKVVIELPAIEVIGRFESTPAGAEVTLLINGERRPLGPAPATHNLRPGTSYEVTFTAAGYLPATRAIAVDGAQPELVTSVQLEKGAVPRPSGGELAPAPRPAPRSAAPTGAAKAGGEAAVGLLGLMSKPPCDIQVDGVGIGQKTPARELRLPVGKHKITLINHEFSIQDSFTVEVSATQPVKVLKDYSDQLPAADAAPQ